MRLRAHTSVHMHAHPDTHMPTPSPVNMHTHTGSHLRTVTQVHLHTYPRMHKAVHITEQHPGVQRAQQRGGVGQ